MIDVSTKSKFKPTQHCTAEDCYTFSHTAQYCSSPPSLGSVNVRLITVMAKLRSTMTAIARVLFRKPRTKEAPSLEFLGGAF